jgi:hypothetical protein
VLVLSRSAVVLWLRVAVAVPLAGALAIVASLSQSRFAVSSQ